MEWRRSQVGRVTAACILMLGLACAEPAPIVAPPDTSKIDADARAYATWYLEQIMARMQISSNKRFSVNWSNLRAEAQALSKDAKSVVELYPAILHLLTVLDDGHSAYTGADGTRLAFRRRICSAPTVDTVRNLPANVGYLRVPYFGGTRAEAEDLATSLQAALRAQDRPNLVGWIVDLRWNTGGDLSPMLPAVAPFVPDSILGYFIGPDNSTNTLFYRAGTFTIDMVNPVVVRQPYQLLNAKLPVAVLTDQMTASSGEATAIALRGLPNTRFFGTATCGQSTANAGYTLHDKGFLLLSVATMADRNKRLYDHGIVPDEEIPEAAALRERAVAWLQSGK